MASAGIRKSRNGRRYQVWWRLDDGTQGSKTFTTRDQAREFKNDLLAQAARDAWIDPRRGRILFDDWADRWWQLWSSNPRRSPKGLETTASHLRRHLRPYFGRRQLGRITPSIVLRWQNELETRLGYSGVMACRSLLLRILEAARKERLIAANPVREVDAPEHPVNPDEIFGNVRRRTFTPEEFGEFLAACRPFYRDHFLTQAGTGLRPGELLGLRRRRVQPERRRIEVLEVRYEAGKFGRGFKDRPKSPASIRVVPMAEAVREAILRRLPPGSDADDLVFAGPGGNRWAQRGTRPPLSTHNYRRAYKAAIVSKVKTPDGTITKQPRFPHLDLHGPHDLRHTFATWLEDAGIPSRVIDEVMGHVGTKRERASGASPMGRVYRETTLAMATRVTEVLDEKLALAHKVAGSLLRGNQG